MDNSINQGPNQSNIDLIYSNMTFLEQFVETVVSYSSKYNNVSSILYAPENLIGKPSKYPNYGDYPDTYVLRSYGKWLKQSEAAQPEYMPQDIDLIPTEDFVTVRFEYGVFPKNVYIYETFNPGAVVRLWGRRFGNPWMLLWEGAPQICLPTARKFCPPIREVRRLINEIRIDFNQSILRYHTSLDAVLLTGYQPNLIIQSNLFQRGIFDSLVKSDSQLKIAPQQLNAESVDLFADLPFEVMVHIFQYLDLKSLCRCAQVNRQWYSVTFDPTLYREVSFKRYWNKVDNAIIKLFMGKCRNVKKLDLTWCSIEKQIDEETFVAFLNNCCKHITHLSLGHCSFVHSIAFDYIGKCSDITDLRLRNCKSSSDEFQAITNLTKLTALDLYFSNINDDTLIAILKSNRNLKYLIIDFCEQLTRIDDVTQVVSIFNRNLVTWSSWKTHSITSDGIGHLACCSSLKELDVGWCLLLNEPANGLERLACGCKDLRRLIIAGWRGVSDHLLLPIIRSCKQITDLDLLGIKNISGDICERILSSLPKLKLLDISYCDLIKPEQVALWEQLYPNVTIQYNR